MSEARAATAAAPSRSGASERWLFGPAIDLLLGAGLAYLLTVPLLVHLFSSGTITAWSAELTVGLALLVSGPHYGATLVRVYERASDRHRYEIFAVYITLGLVALLGLGMQSLLVGSILLTVYVTWSPWHFAGQNYGIALMFLRRRGVEVRPVFKRWLYVSFILSWALAVLSIHREGGALVFAQGVNTADDYQILRAGIPAAWVAWLGPVLGIAYVGSLVVAAREILREGELRDLLAPAMLVATQALWFAIPALGAVTGGFDASGLAFAPIWISTAHAVQYLWITTYYARRTGPSASVRSFLGKALLAGAVLTILPKLIFAPGLVGPYLTYAGVGTLLFSVVNLHHFILDGAVWKLRDGRVAGALLRARPPEGDDLDAPSRGIVRGLVFAVGVGCLISLGVAVASEIAARSDRLAIRHVERANHILAWLGRDHPQGWLTLANRYEQLGDPERSIDAYRRTVDGVRDDLEELPSTDLTNKLASLLLAHRAGKPERIPEALELARYGVRADSENLSAFELLTDAHVAAGNQELAIRAGRRALELARAQGASASARRIERWLRRNGVDPDVASSVPGSG